MLPSLCLFLSVTYALTVVGAAATDAQGNIEIPFQPERHGNIDQSQPQNGYMNQGNVQGQNVPFSPSQFASEEPGQMSPNVYGQMINPQMQGPPQGQMYPGGQVNSYGSSMVPLPQGMQGPTNPYQQGNSMAMTNQPINPQMSMNPAVPGYPPQGNVAPFNMQPQQQPGYPMSPNESPQGTFARVMASPGQQRPGMYPSTLPQYSNIPKANVGLRSNPSQAQMVPASAAREEAIESQEGMFTD